MACTPNFVNNKVYDYTVCPYYCKKKTIPIYFSELLQYDYKRDIIIVLVHYGHSDVAYNCSSLLKLRVEQPVRSYCVYISSTYEQALAVKRL